MIKRDFLLVFIFFILAYALRVIFLPQNSLTFGYDQARDALVTQQIIAGDLKILGPPASTPGLFHGVFYYYYLAPTYLLSSSPVIAAYWNALFSAAVVFLVFYLTFRLTNKKAPAYLAAVLYALSFEATQYATWLSNPTIGIWTVPLMYLGLWMWIDPSKKFEKLRHWSPVIAAAGLGLSIQADVFLLYHSVPLAIWLWVARNRVGRAVFTKFLVALALFVSTMLVAEIKFGFKSISGVFSLLSTQDSIVASKGLGDFILLYFNQLGRAFSLNSYPGNVGYGGVFVLILVAVSLLAWNKKQKISWQPFLASWLFAHITITSVGGTSTPFLLVGIGPAVSILLGISVYNWWSSGKKALTFVVVLLLVYGNLSMILKENPRGSTIFAIQKDMLVEKQLKAIDYTYEQAEGEPFSINTLTSPLWINIVWTYLYNWYGLPKYGYVPQFHGKDQVGIITSLAEVEIDTQRYFLILEPMGGIPVRYLAETVDEENSRSKLIEEINFGELVVQKRIKL